MLGKREEEKVERSGGTQYPLAVYLEEVANFNCGLNSLGLGSFWFLFSVQMLSGSASL